MDCDVGHQLCRRGVSRMCAQDCVEDAFGRLVVVHEVKVLGHLYS